MGRNKDRLEQFLNSLEGDVVSIIPNVTTGFFSTVRVEFLLVVEKVG